MAQVKPLPTEDSKPEFCIIGIGASAGGLEALRQFFSRTPAAPGFACVVVMHLSPEHESHLVEMLQPYTQMQVCQVVRTTALERNRVYVIPPNANLNSIDTHLRLTDLESRRARRAPIDHFLRTLADTHGETAIGVVLSGAGSDGALGIRRIKERGGLTIAQDPQEAQYGSMPQSAIDTGAVDVVLSVGEIPGEIAAYCATQPTLTNPDSNDELPPDEASILEKILGAVRQRTGQEFAVYRRSLVLQRLRHRMRLRRIGSLHDYLEALRGSPVEPQALCEDLLLNVTEFFRDPNAYDTIGKVLDDALGRKKGRDRRLRLWSIGCSTGEEAYSLAMLLIERGSGEDGLELQVFASELSVQALQQAREGIYPAEIAASVSAERLERFFVHENGRYRVRRDLREIVTFSSHDLFKDPPYSHLDLIICRNLLSNLQPAIRHNVLSLFYYALEAHGTVLIGAEDEIASPELFARDTSDPHLLRRLNGPRRVLQLPSGIRPLGRLTGEHVGVPASKGSLDVPTLFRIAVERYVPPSVVVDSHNCVVHFSATASRYVRIPGGELTLDIVRLVPEAIGYRLKEGLEEVRRRRRSWCSEPFAIVAKDETEARRVVIRIEGITARHPVPDLLLIVFEDTAAWPGAVTSAANQQKNSRTRLLQRELAAMQERLEILSRTVHAGAARSHEAKEHRDEEVRATLEELDEARAELQAANEELLFVNQENHFRMDALAQASGDMRHMLESAGLAALLVDRDLQIVRATPLAATLLRLTARDISRPLADLDHLLLWDTLIADVHRVLDEVMELEREVPSADGRWFLARVHPYRTPSRGLEGAVIMFTDITARKRAELKLQESDRRKEEFLAVLAHELRNPLAPITAGLELLKKLPHDPALQERVVGTMARQSRQLVRLVDDLLEVGRINEGKVTLRMQPVAIAEVARDALATVRPLVDNLGQELTVELAEDEPLYVEGDAVRLAQVIGNLLHNASRYTPPHGKIALRARRDGDQVEITVRDNGRGMSEESLRNAFEMFYQARESSGTGLGIGLTLARKLVELHCGSIVAESAGMQQGSKFIVRLPLTQRRSATSPPHNGAGPQPRHDQRVLIVDDNEDAAETLRELLRMLGAVEVLTASSGPAALAAAARFSPSIVLLDLSMPGMDGYELARRIRSEPWGRKARLVALTGWGQEQHRRRSQDAGFDGHLTKPADPEVLRALLNGGAPAPLAEPPARG